jgi:hypothetical protein
MLINLDHLYLNVALLLSNTIVTIRENNGPVAGQNTAFWVIYFREKGADGGKRASPKLVFNMQNLTAACYVLTGTPLDALIQCSGPKTGSRN